MTSNCTRLLSCFASSMLKKHTRMFSHVCPSVKRSSPAGQICTRYFSDYPIHSYAHLREDDFGNRDEKFPYDDVDLESIAKGDPEKMKMLKLIQLEIAIVAQEGGQIPKELSLANWTELLSLSSKHQRLKHVHFIYCNEQRKLVKKRKQELFKTQLGDFKANKEPRTQLTTNSPVEYGLLKTTMFHRFYETDMKKFYNYRLLQASIYGPRVIIDCSFEEYMNEIDISACTKDMLRSWSDNRDHRHPHDIIFCNMRKDSAIYSRLSDTLKKLETDPAFPFNYTDKHYLDLFPKDQLVYLTPHCNEELDSYDGNSTYIIGGIWDKANDFAVTLAKAKKEGIRRAKFPLDKYMKWTFGKKTLSISECVAILNDLKDGKDWDFALRYLKNRQLSTPRHDLYDEGRVKETNSKTVKHFEKSNRQKKKYDVLLNEHLSKKGKKNR